MWIVLLDYSGSMGEPFRANAQQIESVGRVRSVQAKIKWEAAKESFLLELRRLPGDMEVMLIGFTSHTHLIHSGLASQYDEFRTRLEEIHPTNGTDIARALSYVLEFPGSRSQVLLITDGESDLEAAKREARRCAEAGIRVDVLIIDQTDPGLEMASAISGITNGRWDPVASAEQLEKATREVATEHAAALARADELMREADSEYEELEIGVQDQTRVTFSAGYPARINLGPKYPLVVYIHLDTLKQEIEEYIKKDFAALGVTPSSSSAASATRISRGTLITVRPNIPDLFTNPPQQEVVWVEDYHKVGFEMRYAGASKVSTSCSGFVEVLASGVPVGHIPVSIAVEVDLGQTPEPATCIAITNPYARIFASYAHEDSAVVQACKETYRSLGIHLYVDRDDLLSGQAWRATLQKLIAKSDLFQLYWSTASADSMEVAREWQLALHVGESRVGDFIRPLYWQQPMPNPPNELGHIHFAFMDLSRLHVLPHDSNPEKEQQARKRLDEAVFPVISLTGQDKKTSINIIQKSIGQVISYLESLTGLRYYPPATLLVEDYIVQTMRSHLTVDQNPGPDSDPQNTNIEFVLNILQSLALNFHVHNLEPRDIRYNEHLQRRFYKLDNDKALQDFKHVRTMCEYIFLGPIKKYLAGDDPFQHAAERYSIKNLKSQMKELITKFKLEPLDFHTAQREVGHFHVVATVEDKKRIERIIGVDDFSAFINSHPNLVDSQIRSIAERCLSSEYISVTERYRVAFYDFFHFEGETTLCRCNTYAEYVEKFMQLWLEYLKLTADQNNTVAKSGFHDLVPAEARAWLEVSFPDKNFGRWFQGTGSTSDVYEIVQHLKPILMNALQKGKSDLRKIKTYFVTNASTYGIYASAEARKASEDLLHIARRKNWPSGIAMEGFHKILLCTNAIERYKSELIALGVDSQEADTMATWFLVATLVHEHFHAILATGIDRHGKSSWASKNWSEWQKGSALNEALAAWVERHFFRDNEAMFANITEYIQSGYYPDWPYRGAEKVEEVFQRQGRLGVRALMNRLREDPQVAQETFDELSL